MGGGLMQLVAYGAQDIYLTGNPQITFFKVVYRRHTNFSMEAIEQTFSGSSGDGARQSCIISRNGDLIHRMYFEAELGVNSSDYVFMSNQSARMIDTVELQIGGQTIDRHTGDWMEVWAELTEKNTANVVRIDGTGGTTFQNMSGMGGVCAGRANNLLVFVPLQFWFCRNPGLALPLIALQYHEVELIVSWNSITNSAPSSCILYVDYIYLDTDERRRFAQVSHEYLIEQLQYQGLQAARTNDLNFNHPVKELIWTANNSDGENDDALNTYYGSRNALVDTNYKIKLNGHDRFKERPLPYFTTTQIWEHHSGTGGIEAPALDDGSLLTDYGLSSINATELDTIAVYSFSLKPEEHQPSGTCNFSRIDNAQLVADAAIAAGVIYAVNYNVLRIMSGMGGLAYSN